MLNAENSYHFHRNPLRPGWNARERDTLTATLFQIEAALSIQLANVIQPDRERSYRALEELRSILTSRSRRGNDHSSGSGATSVPPTGA